MLPNVSPCPGVAPRSYQIPSARSSKYSSSEVKAWLLMDKNTSRGPQSLLGWFVTCCALFSLKLIKFLKSGRGLLVEERDRLTQRLNKNELSSNITERI